jgi:hypothetical protein
MSLPHNTIPVVAGAVLGAIAISILSLANGWVITSSKMTAQLEETNTSVQASICAGRAETFLKKTNSTANLEGYQSDARDLREELALANASPLQGDDAATSNVVSACARLLNKPHA